MRIKHHLKAAARLLFVLLALPLHISCRLLAVVFPGDEAFASASQLLCVIPGKLGTYLRAAFYRLACNRTSQEISVGFLTLLSHADTTIETGVYIGPQGNIGMCRIGRDTLLGSGVHILSGKRQHNFSDRGRPIQEQGGEFVKISIGEDSWIGNGAIIMADVGKGCVVAAGSVVNNPIADYTIVAGNPARVISQRDAPETAAANR